MQSRSGFTATRGWIVFGVVAILVSAFSGQLTDAQAEEPWQRITTPDGTFSFELPTGAEYTQVPREANGETWIRHTYKTKVGDILLEVLFNTNPKGYPPIRETGSAFGPSTESNKIEKLSWRKFQGLEAIDETRVIKLGPKEEHFRVVQMHHGNARIGLFTAGPVGSAQSPSTNRLLDSLRVEKLP